MTRPVLRLGTRRSALARAQSGAVARRLEQLHPGLRVELVGIDTRGDRILDTPLSQVDGKEFFTAEIDAALLAGSVDLTVHSFKDLALQRPAGLHLGAVPARENPRDIVLFAADVRAQIARGVPLRIGSSSPRRAAFVPAFLEQALPGGARVQRVELRGNVDSRLRRLCEPRGSERQLDGVVLAFAGLSRLWQDPEGGGAMLRELLRDLPRMLLPLTVCPAAPAQGALAIECRTDDDDARTLLRTIDDAATRTAVAAERLLLAERGGGCHQRFGATQRRVPGLGTLLYTREDDAGSARSDLHWHAEVALGPAQQVTSSWDGSRRSVDATIEPLSVAEQCASRLATAPATFIAHRHALPALDSTALQAARHVWVPGSDSWLALAARGLWVEGCAEGLGFETLRAQLAEPLLQLPALADWLVLTHAEAVAGWRDGQVLATYQHAATPQADEAAIVGSIAAASHLYWHSGAQFERWGRHAAPGAHHGCGFGRTAERLRNAGIVRLTVFPSAREWRAWVGA